jgi:hypothetical protein
MGLCCVLVCSTRVITRCVQSYTVSMALFRGAETLPRPESGDVWVLRNIIHDWNDADSQRILSAIRAAAGATPGVTLCFVEVRGVLPAILFCMC